MKNECKSYSEKLVDEALIISLRPKTYYCRNIRPTFMCNEITGRNLELDFWIPKLKLAFEIQGPHHFDDAYQLKIDRLKHRLTALRNIILIPLKLDSLNITVIHKILWDRACELKDHPGKYVHKYEHIFEGVARQQRSADSHTSTLIAKYGYSETLPAPLLSKDDEFIRNLQLQPFIQFVRKGKKEPPRRILHVDITTNKVLIQMGKWRQHFTVNQLKEFKSSFPLQI